MTTYTWYWISLDYATFGIAARANNVVQAAPIAHWTINKSLAYVLGYYQRRGARIVPILG